ncbi:MAG: hypothetical protein ACI8TP_003360, partial [Acidimicrobiales bacterium]
MRWLAVLLVVGLMAVSCGDSGADAEAADGDEAVALAESEGRSWRIGRNGEEFFAMDASLVEGRVTFEVDDGMVTAAGVETETGPEGTVADEGVLDDPGLAGLEADAVQRLVTVDNTFATNETGSHHTSSTSSRFRPTRFSSTRSATSSGS